jgi:hypothetical protein
MLKTGGSGSAVEHLLAKERVASSNLVFRSIKISRGDVAKWLRRGSAKPLFTGSNPVVASKPFLASVDSSMTFFPVLFTT